MSQDERSIYAAKHLSTNTISYCRLLVKFAVRFYSKQYAYITCMICAYTHSYSSLLHVTVARMRCTLEEDRRREQKEREGVSTNPWRPCICKERTRTLREDALLSSRTQTQRTGTEQNAVARALLWCSLPVRSVASPCVSTWRGPTRVCWICFAWFIIQLMIP